MDVVSSWGQAGELERDNVLACRYDVALLDLDGVVYVGAEPVEYAAEALKAARAGGMRLAFVTNNASRPPELVAAHLTEIGVDAFEAEVITSAQAAARLLAERLPAGARVLVVGGEGLVAALREQDLEPVWTAENDPAAVVQGFAPDVSWRALAEGTYAVASGALWVASNLDRTIPTARGIAPGNGALVDVVRAATGREPTAAGKPELPMHREAMLRTGAERPLVVGDRLDTDVEAATRAGVASLLVLTGVTRAHEVVTASAQHRPAYVGSDLRALHQPADSLSVGAGESRLGGWVAEVEHGQLRLHRVAADVDGDARLDAVRAACGAVWACPDGVATESVRSALGEAFAE